MTFTKLEKNICDVIKEGQVKLGYQKETVRLYYPLSALNRFLNTDFDVEEMIKALNEFTAEIEEKLGCVNISNKKERFCFMLPPEASEYVHQNTESEGFLYDFIETVSRHGVSIEDVIHQFEKYSDCVHIERADHGEFDYLVYFEDGVPDEFRYCLTDEGGHIIYHRFTIEDYNDSFAE